MVLFGVSKHKAASLMLSPVPSLYGHFPMSISLCLRALQLQVKIPAYNDNGIGCKAQCCGCT